MANILIIDNEHGNRDSIQLMIAQEGHSAFTADDFSCAQEFLEKQYFDIVIINGCLPEFRKPEMMKSVLNLSPGTDIIVLSDSKAEICPGVFDYIKKPVSLPELHTSINNALHIKFLEEETRKILEKEKKFKLITENVLDVIWMLDLDFNLTYISPAVYQLLGFKPEEVQDSLFSKILTPEGYRNITAFFHREFSLKVWAKRGSTLQEAKILEYEHIRKDGTKLWAELKMNFILDHNRQPAGILGITRDIADRKQIEKELSESEENFRNLAENALDGIIIALEEGRKHVYTNKQAVKITGYRIEELLRTSIENLLVPDEYMKIINLYRSYTYTENTPNKCESIVMRKDQSRVVVEFTSIKTAWYGIPAYLIFLRDISEKKTWEQHLKNERDMVRQYLDIVDVLIIAINKEQEVTLVNRKGREILGYKEEEILGKNWFIHFLPQAEYGQTLNLFKKLIAGELEPFYYAETKIITKRGEERIIAWRTVAMHDDRGYITGVLSSGEDITNRLLLEIKLRSSEKRLNTIINSNADGIIVVSSNGAILFANPAAENLLGKKMHELIGNPPGFQIEVGKTSEVEIYHKNEAKSITMELNVVDIEWGGKSALLATLRNITEQRKAQDNLVKLGEFQQSVIDNANVWLIVLDKNFEIHIWNKAAEKISGYLEKEVIGNSMIWDRLFPAVEYREKILNRIKSTLSNNNIIDDLETIITAKNGEQKCILWYIRNMHSLKGGSVGSLALGRDISMQKYTEEKLQASFKKLKSAFEGAIKAVILSLEKRDPYTSGHQKRVAEIAKAIALEMELPTDTIEAIYIAGSMHDIGKISVPVEILSKPGKLTEPEFSIIKEHPSSGYEILYPIEFPWPIADIVYQHHEYCDGTGYPRGLKADQICIEAKILAVADTIEAISSDRPYRPAMGIDEALKEITKLRGTCFDPAVVDTALHLFHEKKFNFGINGRKDN